MEALSITSDSQSAALVGIELEWLVMIDDIADVVCSTTALPLAAETL